MYLDTQVTVVSQDAADGGEKKKKEFSVLDMFVIIQLLMNI